MLQLLYLCIQIIRKINTIYITIGLGLRGDTCNCDGTIIFEHESDFPDYESCRQKCIDTDGCHFFGIWTSINKGYCRLWEKCDTCNKALYPNKVYQLSTGINVILF